VNVPLVTVVLAVLNVAFIWLIGAQLIGAPSLREEVKAAAATAAAPVIPQLPASLVPASFDGLQAEAVFHKSRSFYVAPASPAAQLPPPDYRMVGLMAVPNRPPSAVLLHNQSNTRIRVAAGDQLDGWSVSEVSAKRVVVQLGERTAEINSSTRATVGGIVVTSSNQASPPTASPGMVRVLAAPAGTSPAPPPRANVTVDAAPRLYRPPSQ
jgi:hypothetical protein